MDYVSNARYPSKISCFLDGVLISQWELTHGHNRTSIASIDPREINIPIRRYAAILPVQFPSALRVVCTGDGLGGLDGGCDYDRRRGLCRNTDE